MLPAASTPLLIRKMQIKTTRYHLTSVRMTIFLFFKVISNGKDVYKREKMHFGGTLKWHKHYGKTVWRFLKKLKIELLYDPAIPLLSVYQKKESWRGICTPIFTVVLFTAAKLWKLPWMLTLAMWLALANRMWAEATRYQFPALTLRGSGCLLSLLGELSTSTVTTGYPSPSSLGPRRRNLVQSWSWPVACGGAVPANSQVWKWVLTCDYGIDYHTANSD